MKKIFKKFKNYLLFFIFRNRIFTRRKAKEIALLVKPKERILEIGSGVKNEKGSYYFSVSNYFKDKDVEFIMSDIKPESGLKIIDVTEMNEQEIYDHIICFNVLEHVYDWRKAVLNMYQALKIGGYLHIITPVFYPIHDAPNIFFIFTEFGFKEFCRRNNLNLIKFEIHGFRNYPFAYYACIRKI